MVSEMTAPTRIATLEAPYGREIRLHEVPFESGMQLLRVTIREGRRITIIDLDAATARSFAQAMSAWAATQEDNSSKD